MLTAKLGPRAVKIPLCPETTVGELQRSLLEDFSLPAESTLRLLLRGKTLTADPAALAVEAGLKAGSTIMVMQSRAEEIAQVQTTKPERMRGFAEDDERLATGSVSGSGATRAGRSVVKSSAYRFHELQPLTTLPSGASPPVSVAMARLQELSNDRAVLAILEEHKWSIGKLSEMPPEGLVGVSASCLMGLNRNKGQEILLRLRTDGWDGIRPYHSVIDVLMHELAHCVHSDHDDDFKALNSLLKMEYAQHRARGQRGQTAGGAAVFQRQTDQQDQQAATHAGKQLGGDSNLKHQMSATEAAAAAAAARHASTSDAASGAAPTTTMYGAHASLEVGGSRSEPSGSESMAQLQLTPALGSECDDCMEE